MLAATPGSSSEAEIERRKQKFTVIEQEGFLGLSYEKAKSLVEEKNQNDEELIKITNRVISNSKWIGGCELEFIKTNDNKYYLLEMNPRFPAWVYLAKGCGQNHPEALISMALGEKIKPFTTYDAGKLFIRYSFDQIVSLSDFEKISTLGEL